MDKRISISTLYLLYIYLCFLAVSLDATAVSSGQLGTAQTPSLSWCVWILLAAFINPQTMHSHVM